MNIQILELIEGAKKAKGLTVVIDVFRAFTVECYLFDKGAARIYPIGKLEEALELKKQNPSYVLFGEREGKKQEGCDYGNSPYQLLSGDFENKTIIHTTSAGTQGIVNATGASEIITGSLVNAKAVANYIKAQNPEDVSICAMGLAGKESSEEDLLAAEYIKSLVLDQDFDINGRIAHLKDHGASKFFNPDTQDVFPKEDYPLCVDINKFPFILKVSNVNNRLTINKVTIQIPV
ncbi:MAG: 2-phosphosulfolactate phosphatase [Butyrivibrio sp.]|uniref:2-phosphosulfolactate phosphatase n=1 Tax=Butyrivibrio sp. TaxID=28121 RepID=UPI0025F0027E|nr:2-phosphosulfolactate phosphatase [Butyrivibrio sp.]MCR5771956.1 2-phosphosulfolactate phosphatase [Butyrivibrio sp.]